MKLTKTQIKKIIKEELTVVLNEDSAADQKAIYLLKEIMLAIHDSYKSLKDSPGAQEIFEYFLNENVKMYTKKWQKERTSPGWEAEIEDEEEELE
jgi:hypothetical protein